MKISELKNGQAGAEVEGEVSDISETRSFNKFGRDISVATATLVDDSGSIKLSLWNQDIEKVKVGDMVKITNGFVKEFQGELQLTSGKFGKLEVTGKGTGKHEVKHEKVHATEEKVHAAEKSVHKKEESKKMDEVEEEAEEEEDLEDEDF